MSFSAAFRSPFLAPDEAMRRQVEKLGTALDPDPFFRRRLRGDVMNRFVAAREGLNEPVDPMRPQMGRLGRACLYATFAVAASVGGAMAASRTALPGDVLYPVKLQIEWMRMQTFPEDFRDDLAVQALTERIAEFGTLVEQGEWVRANLLLPVIDDGYRQLAALEVDAPPGDAISARMGVLEAVTERLPAVAQEAIGRAVQHGNRSGPAKPEQAITQPRPVDAESDADDQPNDPPRGPGNSNGRNDETRSPAAQAGDEDLTVEPEQEVPAAEQEPEPDLTSDGEAVGDDDEGTVPEAAPAQ